MRCTHTLSDFITLWGFRTAQSPEADIHRNMWLHESAVIQTSLYKGCFPHNVLYIVELRTQALNPEEISIFQITHTPQNVVHYTGSKVTPDCPLPLLLPSPPPPSPFPCPPNTCSWPNRARDPMKARLQTFFSPLLLMFGLPFCNIYTLHTPMQACKYCSQEISHQYYH